MKTGTLQAIAMADESFPKTARIRKQADFDLVYSSDCYAADQTLVVRGRINDTGSTRLGLSISRKVGNAVVRNRWKRTIREAFRRNRDRIGDGLDLVVRPRKGARCDYQRISQSLIALSRRINRKLNNKAR